MRAVFVAGWALLAACGGETMRADAGADAGELDARAGDAGTRCAAASECDDGDWCTGTEDCIDNFCVQGAPPCRADQSCDRTTATCGTGCTDGDADNVTTCMGDCNDAVASINPNVTEDCDDLGVDEDCNPSTFGDRDEDGDGFVAVECFNVDGTGVRHEGDDCDDANDSVHRTAPEVCDGVDNNCDLDIDEGLPLMQCFRDEDGDGYGVTAMSERHCGCSAGWATLSGDCHDMNPAVHPGVDWRAGTYCLPGTPSCLIGGPGSSGDWNCDGAEQRRYTALAYICNPGSSGRCTRVVAWENGTAPACGARELASICNEDCTVTHQLTPQECR